MKSQNSPLERHLLERIAAPFDALRARFFRALSPWIFLLIRDRALRICLTGSLFFTLAFFFSLFFPLWQLVLGPIIFGIPHFIGDLRYLILRERLERKTWFLGLVCLPFTLFLWSYEPSFAMLGVVFAAFFSKRSLWQKVSVLLLSVVGLFFSWVDSRTFLFVFLHLHNVVGIAIWWFWRRDRSIWEGVPLLLCFLGSAYLLTQAPLQSAAEFYPAQMDASYFEVNIADFASGEFRFRWISLYAFLQSAHYVVWVRLIPEEARRQYTPRSFAKSLIALRDDFGFLSFWGTSVGIIILLGWAIFDAEQARSGYLRLIAFHGFLELAVLVYTYTGRSE